MSVCLCCLDAVHRESGADSPDCARLREQDALEATELQRRTNSRNTLLQFRYVRALMISGLFFSGGGGGPLFLVLGICVLIMLRV